MVILNRPVTAFLHTVHVQYDTQVMLLCIAISLPSPVFIKTVPLMHCKYVGVNETMLLSDHRIT